MWPRVSIAAAFVGSLVLAASAAAQALTFAAATHPSFAGARAIVTADFNRDGWPDIAHGNTGRNTVTVLLNHGGHEFRWLGDVLVGSGPFALTTADFNRDGIPEPAASRPPDLARGVRRQVESDGDRVYSVLVGGADSTGSATAPWTSRSRDRHHTTTQGPTGPMPGCAPDEYRFRVRVMRQRGELRVFQSAQRGRDGVRTIRWFHRS